MPRPPDDTSEVVPSAIRVYRHLPVFGFIVSPLSLVFSVFGLASTSFGTERSDACVFLTHLTFGYLIFTYLFILIGIE